MQLDAIPLDVRSVVESEGWRDRTAIAPKGLRDALAGVHPDFRLVKVRADIGEEELPPGAEGGRWHVRKLGSVPFFAPICSPGGGYREPDSGILRELEERDMRRADVSERVFSRHAREGRERDTAKALRLEQDRDEARVDLRAGRRVQGRIYRDDGSVVRRKVA